MSFLDNLSALLPFGKKEQAPEYFFALNIGTTKLTAALWYLEGKELKILEIASNDYSSNDEIANVTDKLLDQVLGIREIEPQKILFGVPQSWLSDDNLKDEYLKILRNLVKELELTPMAYVAGSHALIHFLEKKEAVPTTAIIVGFDTRHLTVIVVRAGKLDGVKTVTRGETSAGVDIEKTLLAFTEVETLPSKILIYGLDEESLEKLKSQLLAFSWMLNLSFLHFPKIDILEQDLEIESICLAGGSEINSDVSLPSHSTKQSHVKNIEISKQDESTKEEEDSLGFAKGDVSQTPADELVPVDERRQIEIEDFEKEEQEIALPAPKEKHAKDFNFKRFIPKSFGSLTIIIGIVVLLIGSYLILPKADVKIFVEPKILEKDAQVTADPNQKTVDEEAKIIPGQVVETESAGSSKASATGKKQIGDPAKGTVKIINNTNQSQVFSKGTILTSGGLKFTLDSTVNIASTSAFADSKSKQTASVTATAVGADGNLPSGVQFVIAGASSTDVAALSEGNFSRGTSNEVTVVSDEDQKKLLALLASDLRKQAQQKLQEKFPGKKILEEALAENIIKKSYSKNINDQASEFSLDLTVHYKGTAFEDKDLKLIVSKLVTMEVPEGFALDLEQTETQADVSKLEKDGKLIFLARFKAKLLPKLDTGKIKNQIRFKSSAEVGNTLKSMENILSAEIIITPSLPSPLQRLPILERNIKIEVGLK